MEEGLFEDVLIRKSRVAVPGFLGAIVQDQCSETTMRGWCWYPPLLVSKIGKEKLAKPLFLNAPSHDPKVIETFRVNYEKKWSVNHHSWYRLDSIIRLNSNKVHQRYRQGSLKFYLTINYIY